MTVGAAGAGAGMGQSMGTMFNSLIAGGIGTTGGLISGYLANKANKKQTKRQQEAFDDAINYLVQAQNQPVSDVFGTTVGPNGNNFGQQAQLRAAAQEALARNLQAQKINNARALQTDKDAQNAALLQNSRLANAYSQQSANTAMQAALRDRMMNPNTVGKNIYTGNQNAQALINAAAAGNQNNNINQIGQDTQLTGLGANYVNSAQNTMNNYQNARNQYASQIANLKAGMPVGDGYSGWGAALQSGVTAGLRSMASAYGNGSNK